MQLIFFIFELKLHLKTRRQILNVLV